MIIDRIDVVRSANELEKYHMDIYGCKSLYVVIDKNNKEYTVQWTSKALDEFCNKRTVSEMLKSWEKNTRDTINKYLECVKTGEHPYWTKTQYYYTLEEGRTFPMERTIEIPSRMNKEQIKFFKSEAEKMKVEVGKLRFVKIVPFQFIPNHLCDIFHSKSMADNKRSVIINKITNTYIEVEAVDTGYGFYEKTERIYKINKKDIELIHYL